MPRGAAFDAPAAVYEEWRRRPRGVTVFAIRAMKTAHPSRKNGAATPRPPVHVGSCASSRSFPPPMRRHVACSGCLPGACSSLAGKRRAGAPGENRSRSEIAAYSTGSGAAPPPWRHRFCNPCDETGASQPQKRRRHSTPSRSRRFGRFLTFVSPAHAPSRRLQRVSAGCALVPCGQPPRRRPGHVRTVALPRVGLGRIQSRRAIMFTPCQTSQFHR